MKIFKRGSMMQEHLKRASAETIGQLEKRPAQILKYLEPLMKHQVEAHLYNVNGP
jgi:hypothetical protein